MMRPKNMERAARVYGMMKAHPVYSGDIVDVRGAVTDVITDLRHLCERDGIDFEYVVRASESNFKSEQAGADDPE